MAICEIGTRLQVFLDSAHHVDAERKMRLFGVPVLVKQDDGFADRVKFPTPAAGGHPEG